MRAVSLRKSATVDLATIDHEHSNVRFREIDLTNCDDLRTALRPLLDARAAITIDLAAVTFMDSPCLAVFAWARTTTDKTWRFLDSP
jgi:anti-anti-sigma regulatory factor